MSEATIYVTGSVNMPIRVNLTDTISSVLDQINIQNFSDSQNDFTVSNSNVLFNNISLSPALSLMFYGIHDGSQVVILRKDPYNLQLNSKTTRPKLMRIPGTRSFDCFKLNPQISPSRSSNVELTLGEIGKSFVSDDEQDGKSQICFGESSYRAISNSDGNFRCNNVNDDHSNSILTPNIQLNRNDQNCRSANEIVNKKMQKIFIEKCSGNMRDPEFVFQRFKDSINPDTAFEAARITDIYRSKIESNSLSFRKLCKKYNNLSSNDRIRKNPSMPTILPNKANEPSTEFLPELCSPESRPIHTGQ